MQAKFMGLNINRILAVLRCCAHLEIYQGRTAAATTKTKFLTSSFSLQFSCDLMKMRDCRNSRKAAARHTFIRSFFL